MAAPCKADGNEEDAWGVKVEGGWVDGLKGVVDVEALEAY